MTKRDRSRPKRIRNLFVVCFLTAVVFVVSTYAWFIGMQTVSISSFDVEIASSDSLLLSLNGEDWDTEVDISKSILDEVSYKNHTNSWGGDGLIPMSSVGEMDLTASRMKLYEKASLTATPGGYRLLAGRVNNYSPGRKEQEGYVVFDLFIKNFSGKQYIQELNPLDEEAIYLMIDSEVKIAQGGVADTGIENSVRVAFAQIGRVAGTTNHVPTITGITCASDSNVTGLCRKAQIWEPNETKHSVNAINYYNSSCKRRIKADITKLESYSGECNQIIDGVAYPTYAVRTAISSANNVDIYDGAAYNGYTGSSQLQAYPYFTDTHKEMTGPTRPAFMMLSPNSITKVRIYVYIEGQDIDNYNFAQIGKKISVEFGFTKERFNEDDFDYEGPPLYPDEI
jgi:hypothetical protein